MTIKEVSTKIAKSNRLKQALFSDEANEVDLLSIFVDFGLAVFDATKEQASVTYGRHRYMNSVDVKKFIKDMAFPVNINFSIR